MKNRFLSILTGKQSIRVKMFWYLGFSLLIALLATLVAADFINRSKEAFHPYFFNVPIFVFVGVFFTVFYIFTRRILKYLVTISDGLVIVAHGDLQYRVPELREDELGKVAMNINAMAAQLQQQIQKEREQEKLKMDLITGVSHDLRTPLTSIIGYLDLLKNKSYQSQTEQERFIRNTHSKAVQLKKQIDDLFEYTRLTSNKPTLHLQRVNIKELLEQMLFEFEPIAQENGITICRDIGEHAIYTLIDNEKFVRAIDNLLMNALKFSIKPGTIDVSLESNNQTLLIMIKNMGSPITEEQEKHLFDRFYKVDDSRSRQAIQTGAGLGLSITKSIVGLHHGTVTLSHTSGHFTFTIEIPIHSSLEVFE